jgi:hypothetical protein
LGWKLGLATLILEVRLGWPNHINSAFNQSDHIGQNFATWAILGYFLLGQFIVFSPLSETAMFVR